MKSSQRPALRGVGNDLVEIERVRQSIDRHGLHFLNRIFTRREQDYCYKFKDPAPHFAGRFAAKEALVKALGTGIGAQVSWHDIEILNDDLGKPVVFMTESLQNRFENPALFVSISHTETLAIAIAIWA